MDGWGRSLAAPEFGEIDATMLKRQLRTAALVDAHRFFDSLTNLTTTCKLSTPRQVGLVSR
jgi:hypothetical protein